MKIPPQKGFTLVEMILYVAICSILMVTISVFLSFLLDARIRSQAITEVNQQGFQVLSLVTQTIRNGRSIETPTIGTSSSTLSVTTGDVLLNPTIFTTTSGRVQIKEGSKNPIPLTNSRVTVSDIRFENVSSVSSIEKIIRISFTMSYVNLGGKSEYSFTKTFTGSATLR